LTGSTIDSLKHSLINEETSSALVAAQQPVLIEPEIKDSVFVELNYELNPLDELCNKRFLLKSKSLKIVYHATTINNIVYFFRSDQLKRSK
jgi:hypothetical protein